MLKYQTSDLRSAVLIDQKSQQLSNKEKIISVMLAGLLVISYGPI